MARSRAAALLLLVVFLAPAAAREYDGWRKAASQHFELYSAVSDRHTRNALQNLEDAYAVLTQVLAFEPRSAPRIRAILFPHRKFAARFAPIGLAPCSYFVCGESRDYIAFPDRDGARRGTIAHEVVHALVTRQGIEYPLWFSEGLAVYYSTIERDDRRVVVGGVPREAVDGLRQVAMCGITDLVSGCERTSSLLAHPRRAAEFYARSWALTHMLLEDPRYRAGSAVFMQALARGMPSAEAFSVIYGKNLAGVQLDLSSYLHLRLSRGTAFTLRFRPVRIRPAIEPVNSPEIRLVLADLLLTMGRIKEAGSELVQLEADLPDSWELHFCLGRFARSMSRIPEACERFERAVALRAPHPGVYVAYAKTLRDLQAGPARVQDALETALGVDPSHPEARYLLGLRLLTDGHAGPAAEYLALASPVPRRRLFSVSAALAYALFRLGRTREAKAAGAEAMAAADSEGRRRAMQRFLASIDGEGGNEAMDGVRAILAAEDAGF